MLTKDYKVLQYNLKAAIVVIPFPFQTYQEQIGLQQKCCPLFQGCGLRKFTRSPKVRNHEIPVAQHLSLYEKTEFFQSPKGKSLPPVVPGLF